MMMIDMMMVMMMSNNAISSLSQHPSQPVDVSFFAVFGESGRDSVVGLGSPYFQVN